MIRFKSNEAMKLHKFYEREGVDVIFGNALFVSIEEDSGESLTICTVDSDMCLKLKEGVGKIFNLVISVYNYNSITKVKLVELEAVEAEELEIISGKRGR